VEVLLVNKFFRPGAGAETAFFQTRDLLSQHGHDVIDFAMQDPANLPSPYSEHFAPHRSYTADGPPLRRAIDAASSIYSPAARRALSGLLDRRRPDVAHLHNIYHQLTFSIVDELAERRIPIVLTLHDWKIACPSYTLFTEGKPCRRCPSGTVLNAVRHRCVKGSLAASGLAAAEATMVRRRRMYDKVHRLIAPSRFGVSVARMGGARAERVEFLPNFLSDQELRVEATPAEGPLVVYAGRLEETKGIRVLLEAFGMVREPAALRVAGSGELEAEVRAAAARDPRIEYLGRLPREEMYRELAHAQLVVLPALYEDNGPLTILEAQARGKPMIVSDRGGLPEFVEHERTGLVVPAGDARALADAISRVLRDPSQAETWGRQAQEQVRRDHAPAQHYERLLEIYSSAIQEVA
jgi:glycosyltransferase involved in cell wall biosynthesis